jgi:hypothetical protein
MFAKLAPLAMRLAAIYAVLDLSEPVSARHLMAALRVMEFSTASAEWALGAVPRWPAACTRRLRMPDEPA